MALEGMNSLWLCCDPEPSKDLKASKGEQQSRTNGVSSPFLGVFTEDPVNIAKWLKRPTTPAPAETLPVLTKSALQEDDFEPLICESPPSHCPFDFVPDAIKGDLCSVITIF